MKFVSASCSALGLLGILLLTPKLAPACLNGVELSRNEAVKLATEAESALSAGDAKRALTLLEKKLDVPGGYDVDNAKLRKRLNRLMQVAMLRAGEVGEIDELIAELRRELQYDLSNPWLTTRLAEALSRTSDGAKEATELLEKLAEKDLIVDAEGYAALARLRKKRGDSSGSTQALTRCKAMTKRAAICSAEPLPEPPKTRDRPGRRERYHLGILESDVLQPLT